MVVPEAGWGSCCLKYKPQVREMLPGRALAQQENHGKGLQRQGRARLKLHKKAKVLIEILK